MNKDNPFRRGSIWKLSLMIIFVFISIQNSMKAQQLADDQHHAEARAPHFTREPPEEIEFSNSTGAQIQCKAEGKPEPIISWVTSEGVLVTDIHELRFIASDGTLVFQPFKAQDYRQDVHAVSYRCLASNSAGTIASRDTRVKAVTIQPYDIYVYDTYVTRGNDAVIKCHLPNFLINYINVTSWLRDDRYIINNTDLHEENKYVVLPDGELLIRSSEQDDHGSSYKCKTTHRLSKIRKMSATHGKLFVTEPQTSVPPRIIVSKESVRVTEGENLVLPCVAQGNPVPQVKWMKKTENILKDLSKFVFSGTLALESIRRTDAGQYSCSAKNNFGEEIVVTSIIVDVPLRVTVSPSKVTSEVDQSATLICEVSGKPVDSLYWLKNGKKVSMDEDIILNHRSLTIPRMTSKHKGIYQCFAMNDKETSHGEAIIYLGDIIPVLVETFTEETLEEGISLSLHCRASGTPLPVIIWMLDNDELKMNIQSQSMSDGSVVSWMNITNVRNEDGGVYTCKATNKAGSTFHTARINVHGLLKTRGVTKVSGIAGGKVLFHCPVYGHPLRSFRWMKEDVELPESHQQMDFENGSFAVIDLRKSVDSGDYECIVSNDKDETVTGTVHLSVLVPPKIVPFSFQEDLIREGMRARIQCVVSEGDLPLTIEWTKDNETLHGQLGITIRDLDEFSSILTISSVSPRHNGEYTCTASNGASTTRFSATLSVNVPPKIIGFSFQDDQFFNGMRAHIICAVSQGDLPIEFVWVKDGQSISPALGIVIRNIDGHANSLSIESVSSLHTGNYTCIASNTAAKASHTAQLLVYVAPKITPFSFQEESSLEGSFARVTCLVYQGDLPITLEWLKDNKSLTSEDSGINVRIIDEYSSILTIERVEKRHSGNYTCLAKNAAASVVHTARLLVHVPSQWKIRPNDQFAVKGRPLTIDCQADGFPKPKIIWKKLIGKHIISDGKIITNSRDITLFQNGSLYFHKIQLQDEGYYYCYANNGVGRELSRKIFINVQAPVHFKLSETTKTAKLGTDTTLTCEAFGDLPISLVWFRENVKIDDADSEKYQIRNPNISPTDEVASSYLHIKNITREDKGKYTCSARNNYGNSSTVLLLIVQESPAMPNEIMVKNAGNRSIQMGWGKPFDGHSSIIKYILQYKRKQDSWDSGAITIVLESTTRTTTVKDLQPATIYELRVAAENDVGRGNFSEIMSVIMGEEAPEGSPLQVEVETVDPQSLRISWKPPKKNLWNGIIKGYYIGYKVHGSNDGYTFKELEVPEDYTDDIIYQLNDLHMYTQYSIIVQAYNSGGRGPSSQEIVVMTSEDTPSEPPQEVRCSSLSSRSIYVIWKPPPSDAIHGILKGYKVTYKAIGNWQNIKTYNNISTSPKITLMNLEVVTNYSIQVAAFTKLGEGVKSEPVFCKTYEDVPGSPETIKALPVNEDTILVAWKPPRRPTGAITKYNIYYIQLEDGEEHRDFSEKGLEGVSVVTVETLEKFHEISGLTENKRYAFWVTALSSIGEGPISTVVTQTPTKSKVPATSALFDDVIKSQWNKDMILLCKAVGIPVPDITWFHRGKLIDENDRIFTRFDGTLVIKKSVSEDAGNYTCKISNEFGQDQIQYSVSVIVPPETPFLDVLSKSLTSIRLRWTPGNDGGSSTLGYKLYFQRQSGKWEKKEFSAETETYTLENLACGATYQIYVEAFNAVGSGKPSDITSVTTYGEAFQIPSKEDLIQEGATFITVHLEAWPSGGCPVQHFVAEYKQLTATEWRLVSNRIKPTQKKLVIPGLTPATWYVLRLTAYTSGEDLNIAEYVFGTLTISGGTVPPNVQPTEERVVMFYLDPWIFIPVIGLLIIIIITSVIVFIYCKKRTPRREQPRDWTQYAGTLGRTRETLGVSVESFVRMPKGGANGLINDYETLRKNSTGVNPYSTTHLPLYNSEMTLRRGRPSTTSEQKIHKQICSNAANEEQTTQQEDKSSNNPFINAENTIINGQNNDVGLYGDCYDSKNYGNFPMKNQNMSFGIVSESEGMAMESKA